MMMLFSLLLSIPMMADAHGPESNCREWLMPGDWASEKARLAADLTSGVWQMQTSRLAGALGQMVFHEFGVADEILTTADGRMTFDRLNWSVEEYNGAPFLVVTYTREAKGRTNLYRMTPTCEGIDLTDAASLEKIRLLHRGENRREVAAMALHLTGTWTSRDYPFDIARSMDDCGTFEPIHGAFLQYAFRANGTFVREWGNAGVTMREQGFWDITADGAYLLFHVTDQGGQQVERTDVARIQEMADGNVVLQQELHSADSNETFCTQVKTFSFQRWTARS